MPVTVFNNTTGNSSSGSVAYYNTILVTVAGGFVYANLPTTTPTKASNQSSAILSASVPVAAARIFNNVFFVDGITIANLNLPNTSMVPYVATNGSTPNSTTSLTGYSLLGLNQSSGSARVQTSTGNTVIPGDTFIISGVSTANWNGSYTALNVSSNVITFNVSNTLTSPANISGGVFTLNAYRGNATTCCLACAWRGRLVLAGDSGSPQNFYMSRAGNPYDWNYGATDASAAVAGNLSTSGSIGEPITALIPYTDDIMLIGCTHSLWMLQGDPADGGTIIPVSSNVGIIGPNAWCKDSFDSLYFVGTDGLYKGRPLWEQWQPPQLLTGQSYDQYFAALNSSTTFTQLVWHEDAHYVHLFATPINNASTGTHLIYDTRNEGLWPQQYPQAAGPTSSCLYYADGSPANRGVLLGGRDGVIRRLDQTALDDTGTAISARLTFGPFHPFPEAALLSGTTLTLGEVLLTQAGNNPTPVTAEAVGTGDGVTSQFYLANVPVIADTVSVTVGGVNVPQGIGGYFVNASGGVLTFVQAPASGADILANYYYQAPASPNPWNVQVTLNSGPDAFEVTEGTPHTTLNIPWVLERRTKTFRQRLRGIWFSLTVQNSQLDTYFSFESALLEFQDGGRGRDYR